MGVRSQFYNNRPNELDEHHMHPPGPFYHMHPPGPFNAPGLPNWPPQFNPPLLPQLPEPIYPEPTTQTPELTTQTLEPPHSKLIIPPTLLLNPRSLFEWIINKIPGIKFGPVHVYEGDIILRFYSRKNPHNPIILSVPNLKFMRNVTTIWIIHGWIDHGLAPWVMDMKDAYLALGDFQVVAVDYGTIAFFEYFKAVDAYPLICEEIFFIIRSVFFIYYYQYFIL